MSTRPADAVALGDMVQLRKPHPCGSFRWTVVRLGADIGLRCQGCQHRVLLPRPVFEKRLKAVVARAGSGDESGPSPVADRERPA